MGMYDLGTARGRIEIDASTLGRSTAALRTVGVGLLGVGAAAAAGFGIAVVKAAGFEQQLSRFKAVTAASESQMEALRKKALQLGQDSAFGATEVVEAFVELGKAGATVEEILAGVGDAAVQLAAAGELEMARASEILINALRTFKLPAEDAVRVADLLAGAANASTSEVQDLAESFRYAGPVAAFAGVSIEDLATTLAIFANVGIKGSTAGTSLRGMLVALSAPSEKATNVMKQLGIVTEDGGNLFFDMTGKLRPLGEVFQVLQDKTEGLTKKQKAAALHAIFQRRALAAAAEAATSGGKGFDEMGKAIDRVTAKKVMEEKLDNLAGSLKILKASIETFLITMGEAFLPVLQVIADALRKVVNRFIELPQWVKTALGAFLFLVAVLGLAGGALILVAGYVVRLYRALKDLSTGLSIARGALSSFVVANPIVLAITAIIVGILLLAGWVYFLWTRWNQVWNFIKDHPGIAVVIAALLFAIAPIFLLAFAIVFLLKKWKVIWAKIQQIAETAANFIVDAFHSVVDFFKELPTKIWNFLQQLPSRLLTFGIQAFRFLLNGFISGLQAILSWLPTLPGLIINGLVSLFGLLLNFGIQAFLFLLNGLVTGFTSVISFVVLLPLRILNAMKSLLQLMLNFGIRVLKSLLQGFISALPGIISFVTSLPGKILNALASLPGKLLNLGKQALTGLWNGFKAIAGSVVGFITGFAGDIVQTILKLPGRLYGIGVDALTGLWNGLKEIASGILGWIKGLVDDILGEFASLLGLGSPSRVLAQFGRWMMIGLQEGLEKGAVSAVKAMEDVAKRLIASQEMVLKVSRTTEVITTPASTTGAVRALTPIAPAPAPTHTSEGDFVYNNYAREVDPKGIVDEYTWQRLQRVGRRIA